MNRKQYVLAGIDGSATLEATLALAAREARIRGTTVRVLTARRGSAIPGGARHRDLADDLIDASRDAAMVVVGRQDKDICQRVGARADCPVIVSPAESPDTTQQGPVILALDIKAPETPLIEFAFAEASARRSAVVAVSVWSGDPPTAFGAVDPFAFDEAKARDVVDRLLSEALAGFTDEYPDLPVERRPIHDVNIAEALLRQTARAGLIVVGASHEQRYSGQLLGSVARALLERSACPVAVVHL